MTHAARSALALAIGVAGFFVARSAAAEVLCNDTTLPDPIIVAGTTTFEPTLRDFAVKVAAGPAPRTIVYTALSSCAGIAAVINGTDLGGTTGFHYTVSGQTYARDACTFAPGQKAHVAVSDLFYESCSILPQPKPSDLMDAFGTVQAPIFIAPMVDTTTQYLTYDEARAIYGCGLSPSHPILGLSDPMAAFCWNAGSGVAAVLAGNLGLPLSNLVPPRCAFGGGTTRAVTQNFVSYSLSGGLRAIGFITADGLPAAGTAISPLAFQAVGQTKAYYPDSRPDFPDRKNVRDGHYPIWGYEHLFASVSGGSPSREASDLIGWINGTKTSASFDHVVIEGAEGLVPQCAMRVKRSTEGGPLSPYSPPQPCHCAFEAIITSTIPPGCTLCTSNSGCSAGVTCRRGFCE